MLEEKRRFGGALGALMGAVAVAIVAGVLVAGAITPVVAMTGMGFSSAVGLFENLPNYIKPGPLSQTSSVYGVNDDGSKVLLASFFRQNRESVGWDAVSQYVKDATVATEDPRYYEHGGLDVQSSARALVGNFASGEVKSGASTIAQQYVKNILVQRAEAITDADERKAAYEEATATTIDRKLREMRFAIGLEKEFSKDDILLGYLNIALFGGRVYGIESAAKYYFGVSAKDLTLAQAASLVATVNQPEALRIDVPENIPANQFRRDKDVLASMLKAHVVTQADYDAAIATPVTPDLHPPSTGCQTAIDGAGFFCDYVKRIIQSDPIFGATEEERARNLDTGGYQIITSLNMAAQHQAFSTVNGFVPYSHPRLDLGGSLVTVEPSTGRVLSMAQNKTFSEDPESDPTTNSAINYNTDYNMGGSTGFQVGSTYKLFTLLAWLKAGHTLNESVNGGNGQTFNQASFRNCEGGHTGRYSPQNDAGESGGNASVLLQFEESVNNAFIAMSQKLDACDIRDVATSLGVHRADGGPLQTNITAVLGTNEIAPLTMAAAYAGVANGGKFCTPVAIDSMTDWTGKVIDVPKSTCTQVIDPKIAATALFAMKGVITSGTATPANPRDGVPHFGKTGTTDNEESIWLVGGTSNYVTASWTGNISGHVSIRRTPITGPESGTIYSGTTRLLMWKAFYAGWADNYGGNDFPMPR
jgi:membrane peptidoglycan carboxypeptidase